MDFEFISDTKFKNLIRRDFKELEICLLNKCPKSVLILSGSIIEAILVDFLIINLPLGETKESILKKDLFSLIELGYKEKFISQRSKDLSSVIRSYRNLIHPGREIRESEKFDEETASISFSLVKIISQEIETTFSSKFTYSASDIIQKLEKDILTYTIFENLVDRINYAERIKLLNNLTDYNLQKEKKSTKLLDTKPYIQVLKALLNGEIIKLQVNKLVGKIVNGNDWEILELYHLYNDDISLLNEQDKELVVSYMLGYLDSHRSEKDVESFYRNKLYATIGKYLNNDKLKKSFKDTFLRFIYFHDYTNAYSSISFIDQILNSLETEFLKETESALNELPDYQTEEYMTARVKSEELPF